MTILGLTDYAKILKYNKQNVLGRELHFWYWGPEVSTTCWNKHYYWRIILFTKFLHKNSEKQPTHQLHTTPIFTFSTSQTCQITVSRRAFLLEGSRLLNLNRCHRDILRRLEEQFSPQLLEVIIFPNRK